MKWIKPVWCIFLTILLLGCLALSAGAKEYSENAPAEAGRVLSESEPRSEKPETHVLLLRVVLVVSNLGLITVFFVLIRSDLRLIAWDKRKRKDGGYGPV